MTVNTPYRPQHCRLDAVWFAYIINQTVREEGKLKRIETARFTQIVCECIELHNTLCEKEAEIGQIEESKEDQPAFFDSIEHYYDFTDTEEFRQMQLEHLRKRVYEIKFSLFTHSKRLENEGTPVEVWIVFGEHMVMLPSIENEDDFLKVQAFT